MVKPTLLPPRSAGRQTYINLDIVCMYVYKGGGPPPKKKKTYILSRGLGERFPVWFLGGGDFVVLVMYVGRRRSELGVNLLQHGIILLNFCFINLLIKKKNVTLIFFAEEERERDLQYSTVIRQMPGPGPLGVVAMQSAKPKGGGALRGSGKEAR